MQLSSRFSFSFYPSSYSFFPLFKRLNHTYNGSLLKPKQIVTELDNFIIGQNEAKKAVANAIHSRWRREQLNKELQAEITPKNILMIGPTGVGKTEIARRLAKLCDSPFLKVDATKYTETGFHGADVDSMITDLVKVGIEHEKALLKQKNKEHVQPNVLGKILLYLIGEVNEEWEDKLYEMLDSGMMDHMTIKIPVSEDKNTNNDISENINVNVVSLDINEFKHGKNTNCVWEYKTIKEAKEIFEKEEIEFRNDLYDDDITDNAIHNVQERGIIFIDELDKICASKTDRRDRADASDEGVQRDLLPLIEGTVVDTKYGDVDTSKILFITSGAFYSVKPKDILPELQGRLPIRVALNPLTQEDMYNILIKPKYNLLKQQIQLMETEGIKITFSDESIHEIARLASEINRSIENIGARRLHTLLEKILEEISYNCNTETKDIEISVEYVRKSLSSMLDVVDVSKYII